LTITKNLPIFEDYSLTPFIPIRMHFSKILSLFICLLGFILSPELKAQDTLRVSTPTVLCSMCKRTIEREVGYLSGVKWVQVDVASKTTRVVLKGKKTTADLVRTTIVNSGYAADGMPANLNAYQQLPDCCRRETSTHE
jgi:mercuric ion binding protein